MQKIIKVVTGLFLIIGYSCQKEEPAVAENSSPSYAIIGNRIVYNNQPLQLIGANAFHSFGVGSQDMNSWHLDVVREFIGAVKDNPISGPPIQTSSGTWLHSLQSIVDDNQQNNKITILCAFGWDGTNATEFIGKMPKQTTWWSDYKLKLQQWALHFKNQPNVWIEVWNEPYRWDRTDGYTDAIWLSDMSEMITNIRTTGNTNIILVPCAEQGQDESVLLNQGNSLLATNTNILFDIHAYEKWLLADTATIHNRLQALKQQQLPILVGETAPRNAGTVMNPNFFLNEAYNQGLSICAWTWKYDQSDPDALLTSTGIPNDNSNNNWGTMYKELAARTRNPQ